MATTTTTNNNNNRWLTLLIDNNNNKVDISCKLGDNLHEMSRYNYFIIIFITIIIIINNNKKKNLIWFKICNERLLPKTSEWVKTPPFGRIQGPHRPLTVCARGHECTFTCQIQQFVRFASAAVGHTVVSHQFLASVAFLETKDIYRTWSTKPNINHTNATRSFQFSLEKVV